MTRIQLADAAPAPVIDVTAHQDPALPGGRPAENPGANAPKATGEALPVPAPTHSIDNRTLQNPLLPDSNAVVPPGANPPKPMKGSNPSGPVPNEAGDAEAPNPPEQGAASHWSVDSLRAYAQPAGELPSTDPIARAARYNALTGAESMVDGLGGTPTPLGSAFEANPLSNLGTSRRRFRVGPVNLIGPSLNVGVSDESYVSRGSQSNGSSSSSTGANNVSNQGAAGVNGFQFTAGISFGLTLGEPATGHYMDLQYGATYLYPPDGTRGGSGGATNRQPFNQQLSLLGEMDFSRLKLGFGISYAGLSGTDRDVGGDANRQLLNVSLTSSYAWTPKTSIDWDLSLPVTQVSGGIGSAGFTSTSFINHQFNKKLSLGLGFVAGIEKDQTSGGQQLTTSDMSQGASTQKFERVLTNISLVPSPRTTLSGTLGVEYRDTGAKQSINPIFSLSAAWTPRTGTSFTLTGNEGTQSSTTMSSQNFLSTSFNLSASQRLGNRMNLLLSVGYEHAAYQSTQSTPSNPSNMNGNRVDNLYTAQVGLSLILKRGWSASVSYIYTDNISSTDGFISSLGQIAIGYTF